MKPEPLTDQILSAANKAAYFKLIGKSPGTAHELSQASLQAMIIVNAVLEVLTLEQKQRVLETISSL